MTEQEARQILGVTEKSTWEEIAKVCVSYLASHVSIVCIFL